MGKRKNCGNREPDRYTYCNKYYETSKHCKNKKCRDDCCVKDPCRNPCWSPGQLMPDPVPTNTCCTMYRSITVNNQASVTVNNEIFMFGEPNRMSASCSKGRWVHGCDCTDTSCDRNGIALLMPDYDDAGNPTGTLCGMLLYDESCNLVKKPIFGIIGNDCFDKDPKFVGKRPFNNAGIYHITYNSHPFRILDNNNIPDIKFSGMQYNREHLIRSIYVISSTNTNLNNARSILKNYNCNSNVIVLPPVSPNNTNCMVTFTSMYKLYISDCRGYLDRFRDDCGKCTYGISNKCGDKHFVANGDTICTDYGSATNVNVNKPISLTPCVKSLKFFKNCGFVKYQYFSLACLDCCDKDDIHVTCIECDDCCEPSLIGQDNIKQICSTPGPGGAGYAWDNLNIILCGLTGLLNGVDIQI